MLSAIVFAWFYSAFVQPPVEEPSSTEVVATVTPFASDVALDGSTGRMVALRNGSYSSVPISVTGEGVKRVDVGELYDAPNYVPKVRHVRGKPMFLY